MLSDKYGEFFPECIGYSKDDVWDTWERFGKKYGSLMPKAEALELGYKVLEVSMQYGIDNSLIIRISDEDREIFKLEKQKRDR
ncbi:MAG: hypothetical protein GY928_33805 [Colwellia sp.]|nr:hypothetical protein [Colwellia sp.]